MPPRDSLLAAWRSTRSTFAAEIHELEDILRPPPNFGDAYVNPANEALAGVCYPTFRKGGYGGGESVRGKGLPGNWCTDPTVLQCRNPALAGSWARGDDGQTFFGAESCVDGRTHLLGGTLLKRYLENRIAVTRMTEAGDPVRCETGHVVATPSLGELQPLYPLAVFHAVAPFYSADDTWWAKRLRLCYERAFEKAFLAKTCEVIQRDAANSGRETKAEREGTERKANWAFALGKADKASSAWSAGYLFVGRAFYPFMPAWLMSRAGIGTAEGSAAAAGRQRQVHTLACPFLGTGVRGAPLLAGARISALAVRNFEEKNFGALEDGAGILGRGSGIQSCKVKFVLRQQEMAAGVVRSFAEGLEGGNFRREF